MGSFWNGDHKYSNEMDELWTKLVPSEGEAETLHGELLRAFGRLNYDNGNNGSGNVVDVTYEEEESTCWDCSGEGEYSNGYDEDDNEIIEICDSCGGSGVEYEEVESDVFITDMYQGFLDLLSIHIDSSLVEKIENELIHGNSFEILDKLYTQLGEKVFEFIKNTENKPL